MLKKLLAFTFLTLSISANAATINVGGTEYDITTVTGSADDLKSLLQNQVWWTDGIDGGDLAADFAAALGDDLGTPNCQSCSSSYTPFFAYDTSIFAGQPAYWRALQEDLSPISGSTGGTYELATWAVEASTVPIPAAAWLFGSALLGLGVVKRRKA